VIGEETYTGNNNNPGQGARRLECSGTEGGWHDGYTNIDVTAEYTSANGDLTAVITNTLDENLNNEAIGYGDMKFEYAYN
jgi:outer membrane receptor for ferrienterochelin and colicin